MLRRTPLKRTGFSRRAAPLVSKVVAKTKPARQANRRKRLIEAVERACNAYIRARDLGRPCISCGEPLIAGYHAGHCRSVGSAPHLRFDERNIHGQCSYCNCELAGNQAAYRVFLPVRIGIDAFEALMADQQARKYSVADLEALLTYFEIKLRELNQ